MKRLLAIIFILGLATFLRFHRLSAQSFWNDEGNSARLSERSLDLIIEGTASDIHPPLYYLILRGWRELVGESEFALRALSAFAGLGLVAITIKLGKQGWMGWLAGFWVAVNPALIYYSQETRMYALLALWVVLGAWCVVRILRSVAQGKTPYGWVVAYIAVGVAGLYTHYFFPAGLLIHTLLFLNGSLTTHPIRWRKLFGWTTVLLIMLAFYAPWLPIFIRQAGGRPGDTIPLAAFLQEALTFLTLGTTANPTSLSWAFTALSILFSLALINKVAPPKAKIVTLLAFALPLLLMAVLGTTREAFYKFMLMAIPFLAILLSWSLPNERFQLFKKLESFPRRPLSTIHYPLFLLSTALLLWATTQSLQNLYTNPAYARADYRGMAQRIADEAHPNAGIILNAPNQWEVFTYYHHEGAEVYPVRSVGDVEAEMQAIANEHDRLYGIFWGEAEQDPERLIERWLDENAFKATDEWVGDVRFVTYALPAGAATDLQTPLNLPFGDSIELVGYTLRDDIVPAGDIIQLTLFWQTAEPLDTRYKLFLHLLDSNGQIVAQRDSEPGGGLALTTTWEPGNRVVDNHGVLVPAGTPPGNYTLIMGLYDLENPAMRLVVGDPAGETTTYPLVTITIP